MFGSVTASHLNILHGISYGLTATLTSCLLPHHYQHNTIRRNLQHEQQAAGFLANGTMYFVLEVSLSSSPLPPVYFCVSCVCPMLRRTALKTLPPPNQLYRAIFGPKLTHASPKTDIHATQNRPIL
jgi:hypothetical protein